MDFSKPASQESIAKTLIALNANGIATFHVATGAEAKAKTLELLPVGAAVMDMSSVTLATIGLVQEIHESGKYHAIKKDLISMDHATQGLEMQKLGAAPEWTVGSVHAVTEDGKVAIASNTGSQLPAYAYGSSHIIWIVGAQKIVPTLDDGMKRIYEYCLPLESERAHKAYGVPASAVNKILIINKETQQNRITLILVDEVLGF